MSGITKLLEGNKRKWSFAPKECLYKRRNRLWLRGLYIT